MIQEGKKTADNGHMELAYGVTVLRPEFSVRVEGVTDGAERLT